NPAAKVAADFVQALPNYYHYQTDSKGRYEIPILPGKGILAFSAHDQRSYPQGVGLDEVKAASPAGNQIIGLPSLRYQNLVRVIDLAPDERQATIDLSLRSTPTITGRVLAPDGTPLKQVVGIYGATPATWGRYNSESFEVRSYEPTQGRRLLISEPEQNLV